MRLATHGMWMFAATVLVSSAAAQGTSGKKEPEPRPTTRRALNIVRQGFPAARCDPSDLTKSDTAWEIEWDITNPDNATGKRTLPSSVLAIRSAKFMFKDQTGRARWLTVLQNLEVGEILVPYDKMQPVFLDVSEHAFHLLPAKKEYLGPNCVLPGEILDSTDPRMKDRVLKEVHDDGLRWVSGREKTRRGEKMLLWALFHGGNYRYILEYGFSDDGVISCRLGATAHNFFDRRKDGGDAHLHVGCWRWDPELREAGEPGGPNGPGIGGAAHNRVLLVRRVPRTAAPNGMFKVDIAPFNANEEGQASEGFADWKAEEFTILRVQSQVRKNSSKDPQATSYDLVPLYATQSRPLEKNAVTIWHSAASYHVPRAEDYGPDGFSRNSGVATTSWAGFLLRPINLFDGTPLYP
jgi:primary-amine oxidase